MILEEVRPTQKNAALTTHNTQFCFHENFTREEKAREGETDQRGHVITLGKPAGAEAASQFSPCGGKGTKHVYTTSCQSLLEGCSLGQP